MNFKIKNFSKKLTFYSLIEGIEYIMPIIPSKDYKHPWLQKAIVNIKKDQSVLRCPGILKIKNEGWIVRAWQDIKIKVEGSEFSWTTPLDQRELYTHLPADALGWHDESRLFDYFENWPKDSLSKIIKINVPWSVDVPKGYILHQFHPAYLDENRFTTLPGMYTSDTGLNTLNVPIILHMNKGEVLIKAGTPIAQLVLYKKESIQHENVLACTSKKFLKKERLTYLLLNMRFKKLYNKIKDFWK